MLKELMVLLLILTTPLFVVAEKTDGESLFIVHFQTGPNWNHSVIAQQQTKFNDHAQNLKKLRKQKYITFGARYADYGVIVIKDDTLAAAKSVIEKDPGVQAGIFTFTIEPLNVFYPWQE